MRSKKPHTLDQGLFDEVGIIRKTIRELKTTSGEIRHVNATFSSSISRKYENDIIANE